MSFALALIIIALAAAIALIAGYAFGFRQGGDQGWDEGYQFANSEQEIRWQVTVKGSETLDGHEHEPLVDLCVHPGIRRTNPRKHSTPLNP